MPPSRVRKSQFHTPALAATDVAPPIPETGTSCANEVAVVQVKNGRYPGGGQGQHRRLGGGDPQPLPALPPKKFSPVAKHLALAKWKDDAGAKYPPDSATYAAYEANFMAMSHCLHSNYPRKLTLDVALVEDIPDIFSLNTKIVHLQLELGGRRDIPRLPNFECIKVLVLSGMPSEQDAEVINGLLEKFPAAQSIDFSAKGLKGQLSFDSTSLETLDVRDCGEHITAVVINSLGLKKVPPFLAALPPQCQLFFNEILLGQDVKALLAMLKKPGYNGPQEVFIGNKVLVSKPRVAKSKATAKVEVEPEPEVQAAPGPKPTAHHELALQTHGADTRSLPAHATSVDIQMGTRTEFPCGEPHPQVTHLRVHAPEWRNGGEVYGWHKQLFPHAQHVILDCPRLEGIPKVEASMLEKGHFSVGPCPLLAGLQVVSPIDSKSAFILDLLGKSTLPENIPDSQEIQSLVLSGASGLSSAEELSAWLKEKWPKLENFKVKGANELTGALSLGASVVYFDVQDCPLTHLYSFAELKRFPSCITSLPPACEIHFGSKIAVDVCKKIDHYLKNRGDSGPEMILIGQYRAGPNHFKAVDLRKQKNYAIGDLFNDVKTRVALAGVKGQAARARISQVLDWLSEHSVCNDSQLLVACTKLAKQLLHCEVGDTSKQRTLNLQHPGITQLVVLPSRCASYRLEMGSRQTLPAVANSAGKHVKVLVLISKITDVAVTSQWLAQNFPNRDIAPAPAPIEMQTVQKVQRTPVGKAVPQVAKIQGGVQMTAPIRPVQAPARPSGRQLSQPPVPARPQPQPQLRPQPRPYLQLQLPPQPIPPVHPDYFEVHQWTMQSVRERTHIANALIYAQNYPQFTSIGLCTNNTIPDIPIVPSHINFLVLQLSEHSDKRGLFHPQILPKFQVQNNIIALRLENAKHLESGHDLVVWLRQFPNLTHLSLDISRDIQSQIHMSYLSSNITVCEFHTHTPTLATPKPRRRRRKDYEKEARLH
jgi:hypothetical protein